jgi:hypothetical protein
MPNENESQDTPEDFLSNLGESLQKEEGIDVHLTEILRKHILITAPAKDAVAAAKSAIVKLAESRAKPQDKGVQQ